MRIFLDGCDGAGKSTLAKYLSERFKLDILCLTKDSEKSINRYRELETLDNVVHDRTFLSEIVYPKVFGREEWFTDYGVSQMVKRYCFEDDNIFVICTAPNNIIRERISNRHAFEHSEVIDNIDSINSAYRELADKYGFLLVDTSLLSFEEIGDMIERRTKW